MNIVSILLLLLLTAFFAGVDGLGCYSCASKDLYLDPEVKFHLKRQSDVFFAPVERRTLTCDRQIVSTNQDVTIEICNRMEFCVILQPNVDKDQATNSTFVVRGCLDNVLRHSLREDTYLHHKGCYLVRSNPLHSGQTPLSYIVCVCTGGYCNSEAAVDKIPETGKSKNRIELLHYNKWTGKWQMDVPLSHVALLVPSVGFMALAMLVRWP